jgi:hypothetical protein
MKSLTESPALLTVHMGEQGQYILRVSDLRHRPLVIGVTRLLSDARSFVVITPSDIKVFAVGDNGAGPTQVVEDATTTVAEPFDAETQAVIDAEERRSIPGTEQPATEATTSEVVGETEQGTKVVRRKRNAAVAGHDEQCQRCGGGGKIQLMMDGGKPAETVCPICVGSGTMKRYGARR